MESESIDSLKLYYNSEQSNPREDPATLRESIQTVAEERGISNEIVDTSNMSRQERQTLYGDLVSAFDSDPDYTVDTRIFGSQGALFGSLRPALVVHYADGSIDVYPHREREDQTGLPRGTLGFLDDQVDREGA